MMTSNFIEIYELMKTLHKTSETMLPKLIFYQAMKMVLKQRDNDEHPKKLTPGKLRKILENHTETITHKMAEHTKEIASEFSTEKRKAEGKEPMNNFMALLVSCSLFMLHLEDGLKVCGGVIDEDEAEHVNDFETHFHINLE